MREDTLTPLDARNSLLIPRPGSEKSFYSTSTADMKNPHDVKHMDYNNGHYYSPAPALNAVPPQAAGAVASRNLTHETPARDYSAPANREPRLPELDFGFDTKPVNRAQNGNHF